MTTRDEPWPQGTPCWIDAQVDDLAEAQRFYGALFGWEFRDAEAGYHVASLDGRDVAGFGPKPDSAIPSTWSTYLAADDVDAIAATAAESGALTFMEPMDAGELARLVFVADPTGAAIGFWQAGSSFGVQLCNVPGTMCWNELHTRDLARAKVFYEQVFAYEYDDVDDANMKYSMFRRPGQDEPIGALFLDTSMPPDVPPHWLVWFAADDCDATAARAIELGATQMLEPSDSASGRMSVVSGPQGEVFGLIDLQVTAAAPA